MNCIYKNLNKIVILNTRHVAFKSAVSLDTIYPKSNLKLSTPSKPINKSGEFTGYIPIEELDVTYSRSSGPGGQNVNTVNTKVDLRFHVQKASWISDEIKTKLAEKYKTKITKDGFLVFRSDLTRSQHLNLADCLEKVRNVIRTVNYTPSEMISNEMHEKLRRRQERATRERLMVKRERSYIKSDRQIPIL